MPFCNSSFSKKEILLRLSTKKKGDNSIGDAINWEWTVQCAIESGKDIVIVSRDGDYGASYKDKWYLNDWLHQEFKQRVSQRRKIMLTGKLSEALKIVHANVTKEMEAAESQIIHEQEQIATHEDGVAEGI